MAEEKQNTPHLQFSDLQPGQEFHEAMGDTGLMAEEGEEVQQDFLVKVLAKTRTKEEGVLSQPVIESHLGPSATTVGRVGTGKKNAISGRRKKRPEEEQAGMGILPSWLKIHSASQEAIGQ